MIVIVPTARPERVSHVIEQAQRQTHATRLCFAPAPGLARPDCARNHAWLLPTPTIGEARNAGLAYARAHGHDWAVFWDDDNYYGPGYCAEIERESAGPWDVLSKGLAFVRHDSGLWLYAPPLRFFPGHSTSVKVAACVDFPPWSFAEDVEWSRRMLAAGARAKHLPPWGLVYDRRAPQGHAYDASETEFLRAHGPARGPWPQPDHATDKPAHWAGATHTATDEAVFRSLEARAARRWGSLA